MNKYPNLMPKLPKEITDYIRQHKQLEKQMVGFTKGCKKQLAEMNRITKEMAIANRKIKEQQEEIKRLKRNLSNFLS